METLMIQANSGIYRVEDSYLDACKRFQRQESCQESRADWKTYDMDMDLWPVVNDKWNKGKYFITKTTNIMLILTSTKT